MNKKGIELSINFLVVLILSIIIFIGGLSLSYKLIKGVNDYEDGLNKATKDKIKGMMNNYETLAILEKTITLGRGEKDIIGLGIYNIIKSSTETEFTITVNCVKALDSDGNELDGDKYNCEYIDENWHHFKDGHTKKIKNNNREVVSILMKAGLTSGVGVSTPKGIYIFNVEVTYPNPDHTLPDLTYDKIKKIYLEVD